MNKKIHQPQDRLFRKILENPEHGKVLLRAHLPEYAKAAIDFDTLTLQPTR